MKMRRIPAAYAALVFSALAGFALQSRAAVPASDEVSTLSPARYLQDVWFLSRDEMRGRGDGSPELDRAADYIANEFREA